MNGKQLVDYGVTALLVYYAYKFLSPIIGWMLCVIPTIAIACIVVGCIKMYRNN